MKAVADLTTEGAPAAVEMAKLPSRLAVFL